MGEVVVLLSTYNGEKYLVEQVESLVSQTDVRVKVLARDDGSTDATIDILENYAKEGKIEYYSGKNLKPARSFMDLIYNAPDAEYYAFCDQDDVWHPDKLKSAILKLRGQNRAALYYHAMDIVDESLTQYGYYFRKEEYAQSLVYSSLFGDEIAGCTMIFNKKLIDAVRLYKPEFITMHDGWVHRVCLSVGGKVIGDNNAYISYRQHPNNVVGMHELSSREKMRNSKKNEKKFSRLAGEMLAGYSNYMPTSAVEFLSKVRDYEKENFIDRLKLAFTNPNFNLSSKDRIKLLTKILMRRL